MWYWDGRSQTLPSRECCTPSSSMRRNDCSVPSWSPLGRGMFITHGAIYKNDECLTSFQPEYRVLEASTKPIGNNTLGEIEKSWGLRVGSHVLRLTMLDKRRLEVLDTFN